MNDKWLKTVEPAGHFTYEVLANYVCANHLLSDGEKSGIETHLLQCAHCLEKYAEVFDFEFTDFVAVSPDETGSVKGPSSGTGFSMSLDSKTLKLNFSNHSSDILLIRIRYLNHKKITRIVCSPAQQQSFEFQQKGGVKGVEYVILKNEIRSTEQGSKIITWPFWSALAAAAVLIIVISNFWNAKTIEPPVLTAQNDRIDSTTTSIPQISSRQKTDSVSEQKPPGIKPLLLAENFIPDQVLEEFVSQKYRGRQTLSEIYPLNGDSLQNPITLKWLPADKMFDILVLNNHNTPVFETRRMSIAKITDRLKPGLYYWQIRLGDEVLVTRKFYVKG